jgi:trimeric autotransporter adhesin
LQEVLRQAQLWERRAALAEAKFATVRDALAKEREGREAKLEEGALKRQRRAAAAAVDSSSSNTNNNNSSSADHAAGVSQDLQAVGSFVEGLLESNASLQSELQALQAANSTAAAAAAAASATAAVAAAAEPQANVQALLSMLQTQEEIEAVMEAENQRKDAQLERHWRLAIRWRPLVDQRGYSAVQDLKALGLLDEFLKRDTAAASTTEHQHRSSSSDAIDSSSSVHRRDDNVRTWSSAVASGDSPSRPLRVDTTTSNSHYNRTAATTAAAALCSPRSQRSAGGTPLSPKERIDELAKAGRARQRANTDASS